MPSSCPPSIVVAFVCACPRSSLFLLGRLRGSRNDASFSPEEGRRVFRRGRGRGRWPGCRLQVLMLRCRLTRTRTRRPTAASRTGRRKRRGRDERAPEMTEGEVPSFAAWLPSFPLGLFGSVDRPCSCHRTAVPVPVLLAGSPVRRSTCRSRPPAARRGLGRCGSDAREERTGGPDRDRQDHRARRARGRQEAPCDGTAVRATADVAAPILPYPVSTVRSLPPCRRRQDPRAGRDGRVARRRARKEIRVSICLPPRCASCTSICKIGLELPADAS